MKTISWLRAWLHVNWDFAVAGAGFACWPVYAATRWFPFMVATIVLSAVALVTVFTGRERVQGLCLRLPLVKQYHKRLWLDRVRYTAARQRAGIGRSGLDISDLPQTERGAFVRDLHRLNKELARAAAPDNKDRKEQGQ